MHVVFMENCIVTFFSASASFLGDLKHYMNAEKLFFIYCLFSAVFAMKIETVILCFEFLIPSLLHTTSAKVTNASLFQSYQLASFNSCVKNVDSTWENEWLAFVVRLFSPCFIGCPFFEMEAFL